MNVDSMLSTSPDQARNLFTASQTNSYKPTNESFEMSNTLNHHSTNMKIDEQTITLSDDDYLQCSSAYTADNHENGQSSSTEENTLEDKFNNKSHQTSNGKVANDPISNGSCNGESGHSSDSKPNGQSNGVNGCVSHNNPSFESNHHESVAIETNKTYSNHSNGFANGLSQMSNGSVTKIQNNDDPATPVAKSPLLTNGTCQPKTPFPLLPGEQFYTKENLREGVVYFTNYRLYVEPNKQEDTLPKNYQLQQHEQIVNLPIGVIDSVELRDIYFLVVFTKYVQSFTLTFQNSETAYLWHKRLYDAPNLKVEDLFCFKFFSKLTSSPSNKRIKELLAKNNEEFTRDSFASVKREFERMEFDDKNWKICELNKDFKFCPSYPQYFVVPNGSFELESVANFRFSRRIPAVVWRSKRNGCVIARSSQPTQGWLGWRSNQDELMLQKMCNICNQDTHKSYNKESQNEHKKRPAIANGNHVDGSSSTHTNGSNEPDCNGHSLNNGSLAVNHSMEKLDEAFPSNKLLILDARSYTAALANRALGGGCECPEYYQNCEVAFMGLPNIHKIRQSFDSLRYICESVRIDQQSWFTQLDNTKWFHNLAALIKVSTIVVDTISIQERPVLVHCSDGWDRTPQIVSLAELMLDPFYRTFKGFKVLIEREWLQFGHKFADRCRSSSLNIDPNERCPVFLQWLDCVHQLIKQFQCEFEFNLYYLIKLAYHTYSCLFGTFTCNNVQERNILKMHEQTLSIWPYLEFDKAMFVNHLYEPKLEVLRPSYRMKDIVFWDDLYVPVSSASVASVIPFDDNCTQSEFNTRSIFVTRKNDTDSSILNEANIDESNIEFDCNHDKKCQSQSKCDLTRSASYENISSFKKNMFENMSCNLSKNRLPNSDSECRMNRGFSDTLLNCMPSQPQQCIDRDQFLSSRTNGLACDTEPKCTKEDDLHTRSIVTESFPNRESPAPNTDHDPSPQDQLLVNNSASLCPNGNSHLMNDHTLSQLLNQPNLNSLPNEPGEHFEFDGLTNVMDRSFQRLQQLYFCHSKLIYTLFGQLSEARNKYKSVRNRANKSNRQLEDSHCSSKHSTPNENNSRRVEALDLTDCSDCVEACRSAAIDCRSPPESPLPLDRPRSMTEGRSFSP